MESNQTATYQCYVCTGKVLKFRDGFQAKHLCVEHCKLAKDIDVEQLRQIQVEKESGVKTHLVN